MEGKTVGRSRNRWKSYCKAKRKQRIDKERAAERWPTYYNNLHQYSKNKIHCSCPLCRAKKKFDGPGMQDLRRAEAMDASEQDYYLKNALDELEENVL